MADVMPYVRLMLCLGWCYCQFYDGRYCIIWADVITHIFHLADVIAFFITVVVGMTLHNMFSLIMMDVTAKWQDGTATFLCFEDGRCYCLVARWNSHCVICDGRCYSQVADGIATQSGWWYLVDVITKLADGIAMGSVFMLILVLRCHAEPHPRYVADDTCLCFYSGMDYWP